MRRIIVFLCVITLFLGIEVGASANTIPSSTMWFQGPLTYNPTNGSYTTLPGGMPAIPGYYYSPGGPGTYFDGVNWRTPDNRIAEGGFDVYALTGGAACVDLNNNWACEPGEIGTVGPDHDVYNGSGPWGVWYDPDVPDEQNYNLKLTAATWRVWGFLDRTTPPPVYETPLEGPINWSTMIATETNANWNPFWTWGVENIPLECPDFKVNVIDLGGGIYRVSLTPLCPTMYWKDHNGSEVAGGYMPDIDQNQDFDKVLVRTEETGNGVSCQANWLPYLDQSASGGSITYSDTTNDSCTFIFTGTSIKYIGTPSSNKGIARVQVDADPPVDVDLYSSTLKYQQVLYSKENLSPGQHTITITVTGTKNPLSSLQRIDVDAFDVDDIEEEYCAPVAEANSLWWLDKKYHFGIFEFPYEGLGYIGGDINGDGVADVLDFVQELAWYKDTNGQRTGILHKGTTVEDEQLGIHNFLVDYGLDDKLYEHTAYDSDFPDPEPGYPPYEGWMEFFHFLEGEVYRSQDVKLDLGFWHIVDCAGGPGNGTIVWQRVGGHAVTVAGVDSENFLFAISDPDNDRAEAGLNPGFVRTPFGVTHPHPHEPALHNNEMFASHDIYTVVHSPSPGGKMGLLNYPFKWNDISEEPIPAPWPNDFTECIPSEVTLTEIEAAVIVSPLPLCGDGILGNTPGETCEPPGQPGSNQQQPGICRQSCTYCGDGIVNNSEQCDDANGIDNDICKNDCTIGIMCSFPFNNTKLSRGSTLTFRFALQNNTAALQTFYFATDVTLPNGNSYPPSGWLLGPTKFSLGPAGSTSQLQKHFIPYGAPFGTYTYHGYVGNPGPVIYHECQFNFEVIP